MSENQKTERRKVKEKIKNIKNKNNLTIKEISEEQITKKEKQSKIKLVLDDESKDISQLKRKYRKKYPIHWGSIITGTLCCLLLLFTIVNLSTNLSGMGKFNDYSDFEHINDKNMFSKNSKEGKIYYVYMYGSNCSACSSIKNEVFRYAKNGYYDIYFLNVTDYPAITGEETKCVGAKKFEECTIQYTPTLIFIRDGVCIECVYGADDVINKLYNTSSS